MAHVNFSQALLSDPIKEGASAILGKQEGILKTDGQEYSIYVFPDSEAVTEAVAKFLQDVNQQQRFFEQMLHHTFVDMNQDMGDVDAELMQLFKDIESHPTQHDEAAPSHPQQQAEKAQKPHDLGSPKQAPTKHQTPSQTANGRNEVVYSSLFALARSFHTSLSTSRQKKEGPEPLLQKNIAREDAKPATPYQNKEKSETHAPEPSRYDREGKGQQQNQEEKERESNEKEKKKKIISIQSVNAARKSPQQSPPNGSHLKAATNDSSQKGSSGGTPSVDSIYIRFMALMARILGQAEFEAHQLYLRIKDRTDAIDVLTVLLSKINSEKGAIDWTNNEEMKKLIDKARALGVEIPEGKYQWSDEEKKLLKENVQMRKDSMEKMTQLERTDMQRYLQEASQCHQARSNTLKLLKEVTDTIIHNLRGS